ncbi:cyclic peptide export ABC transporter [Okeania sp. KiyG1]|uniref:cyclic peptide export ABC transporter n=1 Tax=Okeania sp. KiyG1 TaxID=2720165 RepID=UPI001924B1FD|nr:cyclic peptide export ABC transporter [Okeania sp. KiyG1]GGA32092.1 ABC transporter ATP-binding protein [Okeania sp. KiyG1]
MNLIKLLLSYSPKNFALAVLSGILSGASATGLIILINNALSQSYSSTTTLAWLFVSLCLLRVITNFASRFFFISLLEDSTFHLQMDLVRKILASPLRQLEEIGVPRLLATFTEDIEKIADTTSILPIVLIDIAILFGCGIYVIWLSPTVFLIGLCLFILGLCSYYLLKKKAESCFQLAREQKDKLIRHFHTIIKGNKELKLNYQRCKLFLKQYFETTAVSYKDYNIRGENIFAGMISWGQILFFIVIGIFLFALPRLISINSAIISHYTLVFIYVMAPLEHVIGYLPRLSKTIVSLKNIDDLELSEPVNSQQEHSPNLLESVVSWQCLKFIGVTHEYDRKLEEKKPIIGPIDLTFYPGELVFIIGGNGSGKSTLAKLITGLYTPKSGEIYLDNNLIDSQNREWYCQQFSAIFSDFHLFYPLSSIEKKCDLDNKINFYLEKLQLDDKVKVKNGVLSNMDLSTGQRKRLALLVAYLEDRPIYLFDEWASEQDYKFKKIFYTELLPELKRRGKTILVISHDDQYFALADRIIKLEKGKVIN